MKNKASKQKSKMKGSMSAFGCDLTEHLKSSGQDVPQVLKTCAEFIEKHGVVDGIYRLSGITSNIQRLRQEFGSELSPDLTKEVYLQDIHCVGSLCKLYFRELPNPLLTYELYKKFTDAVSVKEEYEQLQRIQNVIDELPPPHYKTLEYLTKHLAHLATLSSQTNMHARNLALVWAPNLLRLKETEVSTSNGDIAFMEVRIQQTVVEFILNHMEQIFNDKSGPFIPKEEGQTLECKANYAAVLPTCGQSAPMKLMSLEEAQARSLGPNHPARKELLLGKDLPDTSAGAATLYHTVIDLPDSKRKISGKSKKWKNIFNLGRSMTDTKGKLSRNGSVFVRAQKLSAKVAIRPAKSMDSLCSLSTEDNKESEFNHPSGANGYFLPSFKSHTLGSGSTYDLSKQDHEWTFVPERLLGAVGGSPRTSRAEIKSGANLQQKNLPEQLKVFKGDDLGQCEPTSPKNRRMFYSSNATTGSSKPSFPGSLFPLDSSPLHQRKALNISEPFAVSVPLRVSAVISSNSTPCRVPDKDKPAPPSLKPSWECPLEDLGHSQSGSSGSSTTSSSSSFPLKKEDRSTGSKKGVEAVCIEATEEQNVELTESATVIISKPQESLHLNIIKGEKEKTQPAGPLKPASPESMVAISSTMFEYIGKEGKKIEPSNLQEAEFNKSFGRPENFAKQQHKHGKHTELDEEVSNNVMDEHWKYSELELRIIEPNVDTITDGFELKSCFNINTSDVEPIPDVTARRSSFPAYPLLSTEQSIPKIKASMADHSILRAFSERRLSFDNNWDSNHKPLKEGPENKCSTQLAECAFNKLQLSPLDLPTVTENKYSAASEHTQTDLRMPLQSQVTKVRDLLTITDNESNIKDANTSASDKLKEMTGNHERPDILQISEKEELSDEFKRNIVRLSKHREERSNSLEQAKKDDEHTFEDNLGDLELVEPWEDYSTTKQWVTSPLHSPKTFNFQQHPEELLLCPVEGDYCFDKPQITLSGKKGKEIVKGAIGITDDSSVGNGFQACHHKTGTSVANLQPTICQSITLNGEFTESQRRHKNSPKQTINSSLQSPQLQGPHKTFDFEKAKEKSTSKHRPYSLNLDLGTPCIKDILGQKNMDFYVPDISVSRRGSASPFETKSLELKMFLSDHQAPMRRNSAPVSVSSVRTSYMIKTCQAKAVPVIPPKVQYSHVPQPLLLKTAVCSELNKELKDAFPNPSKEPDATQAEPSVRHPKKEIDNSEPASKNPRQTGMANFAEMHKATKMQDPPVLRRKRNSNGEAFSDSARPERSTITQRSSFRVRPNRPQSLILFSPPFPIMDYPPAGDDARFPLSPIKSPTETSDPDVFSKELAQNHRNPEGVILRNKMTMPKSGQRLETSTSCFYQPQRRSMIFDSRSNRQIE